MSGVEDKIAVVVPTYWTRRGGQPRPGDAVYDHPTPLNEKGTLGRLLESLACLDQERFEVVIIVGVTDAQLATAASAKVSEIISQHATAPTMVVDSQLLTALERELPGARGSRLVGLHGYSAVRNLQLLVPLALGASAIVAVDDDEVVTDAGFLDRAGEALGTVVDGHEVSGTGGYYVHSVDGDMDLQVSSEIKAAHNIFVRKAVIMNDGTDALEALPGQIVPTPFCFGGNMVFTPSLASSVCFDPAITRGEDIDYLINARLAGHWFFMNKLLRILHLPPSGGSYRDIAFHKVVQDVLRFVYEREKLRSWRVIGATCEVAPADLDPYPGLFLRDDLDGFAREVVDRIFEQTDETQRAELGLGLTVDGFMEIARERAAAGVAGYHGHQARWIELAAAARHNQALRATLSLALRPPAGRTAA